MKNKYEEQGSDHAVRRRLVVMPRNVESLISNKETLEMYINDREVHINVVTDSNITESKLHLVQMDPHAIANKSYREDTSVKGGGAGGVLIYIIESAPFIPGEDQNIATEGEMEFCSTEVYPNHNYEQPLLVVGMYKPPDSRHLSYKEALEQELHRFHKTELRHL